MKLALFTLLHNHFNHVDEQNKLTDTKKIQGKKVELNCIFYTRHTSYAFSYFVNLSVQKRCKADKQRLTLPGVETRLCLFYATHVVHKGH